MDLENETEQAGRPMDTGQGMTGIDGKSASGVQREKPEPDPSRLAMVRRLCGAIKKARKHFKDDFKRMRDDMALAYEGAAPEWVNKGFYVANIIQSHLRSRVGDLYSKNPRAEWRRRQRMDFALWDGSQQQLLGAMAAAAVGDPNAIELLLDYQQGTARKQLMSKLGQTLQMLFHYSIDEQTPSFKVEMKRVVRRAETTGVGYVSIGYRTPGDTTPEQRMRLADMEARLAYLRRITADIQDNVVDDTTSAEMAELKAQIADMQQRPELVLREGLAFGFPQSTRIVIDPACTALVEGFPGADWIAEEFLLPADEVQEIYNIDVQRGYLPYSTGGMSKNDGEEYAADMAKNGDPKKGLCKVWVMQHRKHGLEYHLLDGYPDFLKEPMAPEFEVEGFFRLVPIVTNHIEHEEKLYPPSLVYALRHPQSEYNRSRQSLREHRRANRPKWATSKGALTPEDIGKLATSPANAVVELEGMTPGDKVGDLLQPVPVNPIDPNLYETAMIFDDTQRVGGSQEANLGGTGGDTATESTIAESSRMSAIRSNTDDIDDALSMIARLSGQILLQAMPKERVVEIVGPGAVWPEWTAREIMEEIYLAVRAGSSGRPNKAQDMQNWERILPFLLQLPGLDPEWVVRETIRRVDDTLDITEAFRPNLPSIQQMNSVKQVTGAGPQNDPNAQGGKGAANDKKPAAASPAGAGRVGPNQDAVQGTALPAGGPGPANIGGMMQAMMGG